MNRKNLVYVVVLAALAAASYFFVFKNKWSTLDIDEKDFAVTDTASIDKIMIGDLQGNKIVYSRKNFVWYANDSFPVKPYYMQMLLSTIKNIKVKEPVADAAIENVKKQLATENKVVEIYDKQNNLLKRYFVGPPSPGSHGTYMMIDGAKIPYIIHLEDLDGTIDVHYQTDLNEIRSLEIFHFPITNIRSVSIDYCINGEEYVSGDSSFAVIIKGKNDVEIQLAGKDEKQKLAGENLTRAYDFLNSFRNINCEAFQNSFVKKDSVLKNEKPFCAILLIDLENKRHELRLYHKPIDASSMTQYDNKGNPLKYDLDRYFGVINNGKDFVLIQIPMVQPLLLTYNMIIGKEKIPPPPLKQLPVDASKLKMQNLKQ